jgi:hypothetical protein
MNRGLIKVLVVAAALVQLVGTTQQMVLAVTVEMELHRPLAVHRSLMLVAVGVLVMLTRLI